MTCYVLKDSPHVILRQAKPAEESLFGLLYATPDNGQPATVMAAGLILPVYRECLPEAVPADFEGIF